MAEEGNGGEQESHSKVGTLLGPTNIRTFLITNEFVAWMETFSIYYLCGKAQHREGGSCLHDLPHTVYYVE